MKYLILLLLLIGCSIKPVETERLKQQIVYFKDDRTGLCFATILAADPHDQNLIRSIVNIPCSKIEKQ